MELTGPIIVITPLGRFTLGGNELTIDDVPPEGQGTDCVKVRGGRRDGGAILGLCADVIVSDTSRPDGIRRMERVQVQLGAGDAALGHAGFVKVFVQDPGRDGDMGQAQLALEIDARGVTFHKPIVGRLVASLPPWPWAPAQDPTHGIPEGDFGAIADAYGFACDEPELWPAVKTWAQVIARMDERDDFRRFPRAPVPDPLPPPITPAERAERVLDVEAARREFAPMELDEGKVASYLAGRSSLREFHDDNVARAGAHKPEFHRPGRQYEVAP